MSSITPWGSLIEAAQKDWQNDRNQIIAYTQKKQDRKYNASMTLQQMAFDKYMADTQYQRGVKDLKAAGLNPVLAAGGASAATASASLPQQSLESVSGAMGEGGNIGSAIREWQEHNKQMELQQANIDLLKAQTDKTKEETNYVGYFPESETYSGGALGISGTKSKTVYKKPGQINNTNTTKPKKTNSAVKQSKDYDKELKKWLSEHGIEEE